MARNLRTGFLIVFTCNELKQPHMPDTYGVGQCNIKEKRGEILQTVVSALTIYYLFVNERFVYSMCVSFS